MDCAYFPNCLRRLGLQLPTFLLLLLLLYVQETSLLFFTLCVSVCGCDADFWCVFGWMVANRMATFCLDEGHGDFLLLLELHLGGLHHALGVLVDLEALDDFPLAVLASAGEGIHEVLTESVGGAVSLDAHGDEFTGRGAEEPTAHVGGGTTGSRHSRGSATSLDDGGTTLLDVLDELALEEVLVEDVVGGLTSDGAMVDIGVHGGRMVAPDDDVLDLGGVDTSLGGQHTAHAVVVQTSHGCEILRRDVGGEMGHDQGVGVGGVTDDKNLEVRAGLLVGGLTHDLEDADVLLHQVLALHTSLAGEGAQEDGGVSSLETNLGVVGLDDLGDQGEEGVIDLHVHTVHGFVGERKIDQAEADLLVLTEHLTGADLLGEGVADLTSGTGDRDLDGSAAILLLEPGRVAAGAAAHVVNEIHASSHCVDNFYSYLLKKFVLVALRCV